MTLPRRASLVTWTLLILSVLLLAGSFAYSVNITVLKDWHLVLPTGDIHEGDTITVQSLYTKLRPVNGIAVRYIECQNETSIFVRYPINEAQADRAPGKQTGTGIIIKIPTTIPGVPTTCRISVNVTYPVYPWRRVTEFASTRDFQLLPPAVPGVPVAEVTNQTSQHLAGCSVSSPNVAVSSPNSTPSVSLAQPDSLQVTPQPTAQPSLVQRVVVSPVQHIVALPGRILSELGL